MKFWPILANLIDFSMQNDTKWGGLKGDQVMAQAKPLFARIELKTESEDAIKPASKPVKKKEKKPKAQAVAEA